MISAISYLLIVLIAWFEGKAFAFNRLMTFQESSRRIKTHSFYLPYSSLQMSSDSTPNSDKLVYDTKANRFYEAKLTEDSLGEEFFLVDKETGESIMLTREEKERIFLDAIQSYYFSGKSNLPDEQFDRLREDLSWEGSALVTLNRNETLFMNAMQAYIKGKPILTNEQFDDLKRSLRESVTWSIDSIRTSSLYVPATAIATVLYLGGLYEIPFVRSNFNPLLILVLGAVPIYYSAKQITENFLFKDPLVAIGPCPNCGVENKLFFGDVLGVSGDSEQSTGKCVNCKTALTIKRGTLRVSTLPKVGGGSETVTSE